MRTTLVNPGGAIAEFRLEGALGTIEAQDFQETVMAVVRAPHTRGVIIDAGGMPYMTSTGLRAFMSIGKAARAAGGDMVVCGLGGLALEIFSSSGFSRVFPPADDVAAARRAFGMDGNEGV